LALALGARAPARAATPAPVRGLALKVGLVPGAETAQPFYAREQGAFGRAGLDVDIRLFTDASAVGAALVAGAIDVAYGGIIAAAVAHDKDPPIVVLAGANVYVARAAATGILVVARASPIRSAADLTGKTVAVPAADGLAALAVRRWVDAHGGDSARVSLVELAESALAEAVVGGRADAASVARAAGPAVARDADPLRVLANTYDAVGARWSPAGWLATPKWIVLHPEAAEGFAAAMKEAAAWANEHRSESAAIVGRVLKEPANRIGLVEYATEVTPAMIEPVIDLCAKYGVIPEAFPAADIIDPLAR